MFAGPKIMPTVEGRAVVVRVDRFGGGSYLMAYNSTQ